MPDLDYICSFFNNYCTHRDEPTHKCSYRWHWILALNNNDGSVERFNACHPLPYTAKLGRKYWYVRRQYAWLLLVIAQYQMRLVTCICQACLTPNKHASVGSTSGLNALSQVELICTVFIASVKYSFILKYIIRIIQMQAKGLVHSHSLYRELAFYPVSSQMEIWKHAWGMHATEQSCINIPDICYEKTPSHHEAFR